MIQINPLQSYINGGARAAITTPPSASLVFDLPGRAIWAKGVKLKGTDHTYTFQNDNYITLTNTPGANESEDIQIGVNILALKNVIDTTYDVVSQTWDGLAPSFSYNNIAEATSSAYYLGWSGTTLKWYQRSWRNIRINNENTDTLSMDNDDPLIISSGTGIQVSWDQNNKQIVITNTAPDQNHNTDYRVTQVEVSNNSDYRILLKRSANNEAETNYINFSGALTFNPTSYILKINNVKVITAADIMEGATSSASSKVGLVPVATSAQRNYFLKGDGTWQDPSVTIANFSTWRPIKVEGSEKLGSGNDTGSLDFAAGTGIQLGWDTTNKKIVITNSAPDQNHNTDRTSIKLTTVSGTKKTDNTLIINNSNVGLSIAGGTNKFSIGDGTNYIEVPITPSFIVTNKAASILTTATTLATINGTDITAKVAVVDSSPTLTTSLKTIATIAGVEIKAKITNYNTDKTGIIKSTVSGTKKTDTTLIVANSSSGLIFEGGTNLFKIGDGTNYVEIPVLPSFTITNKAATIGQSLTTIATIAGTDITAKIADYFKLLGWNSASAFQDANSTSDRLGLIMNQQGNATSSITNYPTNYGYMLSFICGGATYSGVQIYEGTDNLFRVRHRWSSSAWEGWRIIADSGNISNKNATIGTSSTTIATIAGVNITAKIGSYAASNHTHSVKINNSTKTIAAPGGTAVDLGSYLPLSGGTMNSGAQIVVGTITNSSGQVYSGGIQLRELKYSTTSITDNYENAPGITFHWGGRWVHKLNMHTNDLYWDNNKIWHSANDGSGSGLDADTLDGIHASGLFTVFSNVGSQTTRITIGGTQRDLKIDADTTDGLHVHSGRNNEANKIVRTDGSGYIQAGWINTTSGDMGTTAINRVYCSNDGYIRYKTKANFVNGLDAYWANIKVSATSSTTTSPTFTHVYLGGYLYMANSAGTMISTIDRSGNSPIFGYGQGQNGYHVYYTGRTVSINAGTAWSTTTNGIYINASNNIGIGTNSPAYKLHVVGQPYFNTNGAGAVLVTGTGGSYREGIRIQSVSSWSDITLLGTDATLASGTSANSWFLGNNNGSFYITRNGSTSGSSWLANVSNVWHFNNRLSIDTTGRAYPYSTSTRRAGMYGVYDSTKIGHIWSMGTSYMIPDDGSTFGNLYGLAYKHTNNTTGGAMAGGHMMVWCQNGTTYAAMGNNIWARNWLHINGANSGTDNGITLHASSAEYGIMFRQTSNLGTHGYVSGDWATYFTMSNTGNRGWIFRRWGNSNVASISTDGNAHFNGHIRAASTASSWIDGQRYDRGGFNLLNATDTGSYWPWMRQTNTGSAKWFSMGILNNSLYIIGSTTSRTANSYDYGWRFDVSNGWAYGNFQNSDTLDGIHANGLLTAASLGKSGNSTTISVTVGGTTRTGSVTVPYATLSGTVTVNNSDANSTYRMVWHSGNTLYSTGGIYCNPSSDYLYATSFQCSSWFRSTGATGWYSQSYGGGWYMTDSTWIRSYGSKSVYVNTGDLRCDGSTWGGMNRLTSNWHGFYSSNGGGTRYGYIQCDANRMYFRKENGVSSYHFDFGGHIYTGNNMYAAHFYENSDARLKHDIMPISQSIRKFRFNNDNKLYYGFIAQELQTLHPELVDSSGEYKTVNYSSAICYYIAELENKVQKLEDEINKLKNK